MTSEVAWPRTCSVLVAVLCLAVVATPAPAHAAPNVLQEGCEPVSSQEYNYYSAGGYDHVDITAVKWELQRRGWPEDAARVGAEHGADECINLRPVREPNCSQSLSD